MKRRRRLKKGLALLLTAAMVVGLMPGVGTMKVSAETNDSPATEAIDYANGFCTNYEWKDGSLALKDGIASCDIHEKCNGYQPATYSDADGVYEISNAGQLYWFAGLVNGTLTDVTQNSSAEAELTADIIVNANVLKVDGTLVDDTGSFTSWTPIGKDDSSTRYTGTFDGQGHTISGLYFNNSNTRHVGLFGYVYSGGKVSRVGVVDSYFKANSYVGVVCGYNDGGTITNCYNSSTVIATNQIVGGVCGYIWKGTITNCYNRGAVSCSREEVSSVGSVCGKKDGGTITNCYYDKDKCGVGGIRKNDVTGQAEGKSTIQFNGGEVAYLLQSGQTKDSEGNIPEVWGQCLSGEALNDYPVFGGMKVYRHSISEDNPNYYYTNSEEATGHIHQMTKVEAKDATCEEDGNVEYWICSSEGDVYYKDENGTARFSSKAATVIAGGHDNPNGICNRCGELMPAKLTYGVYDTDHDGTTEQVYEISNAGQLYWFAGLVNGDTRVCTGGVKQNTAARAVLIADITVNSGLEGKKGLLDSLTYAEDHVTVSNDETFRSWTPIGKYMSTSYVNNGYQGDFDGQGHTVSGLYYNDSSESKVGLFAHTDNSCLISNIGVVDSYINALDNAGGVCGLNRGGATITNCYFSGYISTRNMISGGVCGQNKGTITNCFSSGEISGSGSMGGVSGTNNAGTITNCYFSGSITPSSSGASCVGGVCGNYSNNIVNCYFDSDKYSGNAFGDGGGGNIADAAVKTTEQFKSGEVAYLLNGSKSVSEEDNPLVWYQNIDSGTADTYPVLDNTHGIVYIGNPCAVYTNESHKEHSYVINADGKSHTCSDCRQIEQHAYVATFTVDNEKHSIKATCPSCGDLGTIRLSASDATYDGTEKAASISDEIKGFSPDIVYEKKAEDGSFATIDSIPKDAGTYRASITYTVGEEPENKYSVSVEYTIAKADTTKTEKCEMVLTFDEYANTYTATITEVDDAEYKFDNGGWSNKNMYTGIAHGTEVTGYIRIAGDDNHNPGTESSKTLTSGHGTLMHVEAKDADCVTDGNSEYWYCEICKKYFSDAQGTTETTKEAVTIPATGHTDSNNDGICEVCDAYMDGIGAKLAGYSLSLNGNIGVNFYMELSEAIAGNENAYMEFTLPNTAEKTKVYVTGTHEDGATATTSTVDDKTYYVFSCEVAAKEMTDEIQAQMIVGENEGTVYTYTVKDYADYILSHTETYGEKVVTLVKAMLNYGAYSQTYFDYQTAKLANEDLAEADKALVTLTADDLSSYKASVNKDEAVCTFASAYLTLQSETAVHVYVKLADGVSEEDVTFKIDGNVIAKENLVKGTGTYEGYYILSVDNIQASALDDMHTFTVTATGGQTASLSYGPMSYCYSILAGESASDDLKNVVKALYAFNQAADSYGAN